jgi:hypothetical protein
MKPLIFVFLLLLGMLPTAQADCFPIRRIMDPSSRADFRNLCRAAVSCDPACQNIEPRKLIDCSSSQDANRLLSGQNIGRRLLGCARAFFIDSMVDLANTVIELIRTLVGATVNSFVNIVRFMTDASFRASALSRAGTMSSLGTAFLNSSVRNFSTEYERNYNAARARGVSLIDAPFAALGPTLMEPFLKMVVDTVTQIAESQISQFRCLNGQAKLESLCAMAGGFIMPPAVLFTVIKHGAGAIRTIRGVESYLAAARRTFTATTRRAPPAPGLTVARRGTPGASRRSPSPPESPAHPRPKIGMQRESRGGGLEDAPIVKAAKEITDAVINATDANEVVQTTVQTNETPNDQDRVSTAETLLGRELSAEEQSALLDANDVGIKGLDGQPLLVAAAPELGSTELIDVRQKAEILRRAGFSREEVRELRVSGITGATGSLEVIEVDVAEATARREAILAANEHSRAEERSNDLSGLEIESVVAARGNLTIAREATGEEAMTASRRALEAATTSGDPELIVEAAQVYATSGGDMELLGADNRRRITALEAQLAADPSNHVLQSQLLARRTLKSRFETPGPAQQ